MCEQVNEFHNIVDLLLGKESHDTYCLNMLVNGHLDKCASTRTCYHGEGDCDIDADCAGDLKCKPEQGMAFNMTIPGSDYPDPLNPSKMKKDYASGRLIDVCCPKSGCDVAAARVSALVRKAMRHYSELSQQEKSEYSQIVTAYETKDTLYETAVTELRWAFLADAAHFGPCHGLPAAHRLLGGDAAAAPAADHATAAKDDCAKGHGPNVHRRLGSSPVTAKQQDESSYIVSASHNNWGTSQMDMNPDNHCEPKTKLHHEVHILQEKLDFDMNNMEVELLMEICEVHEAFDPLLKQLQKFQYGNTIDDLVRDVRAATGAANGYKPKEAIDWAELANANLLGGAKSNCARKVHHRLRRLKKERKLGGDAAAGGWSDNSEDYAGASELGKEIEVMVSHFNTHLAHIQHELQEELRLLRQQLLPFEMFSHELSATNWKLLRAYDRALKLMHDLHRQGIIYPPDSSVEKKAADDHHRMRRLAAAATGTPAPAGASILDIINQYVTGIVKTQPCVIGPRKGYY